MDGRMDCGPQPPALELICPVKPDPSEGKSFHLLKATRLQRSHDVTSPLDTTDTTAAQLCDVKGMVEAFTAHANANTARTMTTPSPCYSQLARAAVGRVASL